MLAECKSTLVRANRGGARGHKYACGLFHIVSLCMKRSGEGVRGSLMMRIIGLLNYKAWKLR